MTFELKRVYYALTFPIVMIILLWIIFLVEWQFNLDFHRWGIYPREWWGIKGILTEPLIHADAMHLFSNTIPLLILSGCLFYFYKDLGYVVFPLIWIVSGMITWCIGRTSWHIGASGLVYGLSFFLFFSGVFRKYIPLLAVSMLVVFLYGSTVWNMFPVAEWIQENISWEGHLSGALTGLILAVAFRNKGPQKPENFPEEEDENDEESFDNKFWEINSTDQTSRGI